MNIRQDTFWDRSDTYVGHVEIICPTIRHHESLEIIQARYYESWPQLWQATTRPVVILTGYRLGVDIGGTFTDAVLMNSETGDILFSKVSTTPSEPSLGFMNAVTQVTKQIENLSVEHIIHATTIATNALLGQIGLDPKLSECCDNGTPYVLKYKNTL